MWLLVLCRCDCWFLLVVNVGCMEVWLLILFMCGCWFYVGVIVGFM